MHGLQLERQKMKKIFQENTTFYELEYSICECTNNEWNSFSKPLSIDNEGYNYSTPLLYSNNNENQTNDTIGELIPVLENMTFDFR